MANITVSANVDTMLQAANNAAIRTAIGAGDVTLAGTQTITGAKTFSDDIEINVNGASNSSKAIVINTSGTNFESDTGIIEGTHAATGAYSGGTWLRFRAGGVNRFRVQGDGDLYFAAGTASGTAVQFANPVSSLCPELRMTRQGGSTSGNDFIKLDTSAGEVFSVDAAGGIDCDNILAGTGIAFGTDTAAANTLDDYEEGSWTPTVLFGGASVSVTYDAQVGRYTKIGNSVSASCFMDLSSKGSSTGSAVLGGLPFTSLNVASNHVATTLRLQSISFADVPMAYLTPNSTVVQLQESNNAGVVTTLTDGNFVDSSTVMVSVTYRV